MDKERVIVMSCEGEDMEKEGGVPVSSFDILFVDKHGNLSKKETRIIMVKK